MPGNLVYMAIYIYTALQATALATRCGENTCFESTNNRNVRRCVSCYLANYVKSFR